MHLTWTTLTDAGRLTIDDYVIEWSIDGTTWTTIDEGVSVATGFRLSRLTNGATYWFRASAVNAMDTGALSELVEATPAGPSAAPGGLTTAVAPATGVGSGQVQLTWTASVVSNAGVSLREWGRYCAARNAVERPTVRTLVDLLISVHTMRLGVGPLRTEFGAALRAAVHKLGDLAAIG